jgi:hypothetical protein
MSGFLGAPESGPTAFHPRLTFRRSRLGNRGVRLWEGRKTPPPSDVGRVLAASGKAAFRHAAHQSGHGVGRALRQLPTPGSHRTPGRLIPKARASSAAEGPSEKPVCSRTDTKRRPDGEQTSQEIDGDLSRRLPPNRQPPANPQHLDPPVVRDRRPTNLERALEVTATSRSSAVGLASGLNLGDGGRCVLRDACN